MAVRGTSATFIGRAEELLTLDRLLDADDDRLRLVLVGGDAGIGKSRLVSEWARRARARGARILVGGAVDVGESAALPYVAVIEALRSLADDPDPATLAAAGTVGPDLARLMPRLAPASGRRRPAGNPEELSQVRLFEQLLALLEQLAATAPTILVLEDLHWADRSTRDLLAFLVRNLGNRRIGLVATFRTDELTAHHPLRALLGQLGRGRHAARISLAPFGPDEHLAHVIGLLGAPPPPDLLRETYARSAGNPFYTEELLADGWADGGPLPATLRDALLARLGTLSPGARAVVELIAIGWSVSHELLTTVSPLDDAALLVAVREAVDRAVVVPEATTGRYGIRHPLISEAVIASLLPEERRRLHRDVARALAAGPTLGDPSPARAAAELANHWVAAGEPAAALPALVRAAVEARSVYAQEEALTHLLRAAEIADRLPDGDALLGMPRWRLAMDTALAAEAVGQFERSLASWREALERAVDEAPAVRADLLVRLGETEFLAGHLDRFVTARRAAVALVPPEPPSALRSFVLAKLAIALSLRSGLAEARELAADALRVAREVGALPEEGKALSTLGTVLYLSGASEPAVEHLRAGLRISQRLGRFGDEAIDRSNLSEALHMAGRPNEALAVLMEGLARAREHGLERTYGETMSAVAINWLFLLGRWAEAEEMGLEILERAPQGLSADWTAMALAEIEIAQGRFTEAGAHLDRVLGGDRSARAPGWYGPHEQRAHLLVELGRPDEAVAEISSALEALDRLETPPESGEIRWLTVRGLQAATEVLELERSGRRRVAQTAAARRLAADLNERFDRHLAAVSALAGSLDQHIACDVLLVEAERRRLAGIPDPAAWREAADRFGAIDHPWDELTARWREGEAMLLAGAPRSEAAVPLRAAHVAAEAMGAEPTCRQIESLARRARVSLQPAKGRSGQAAEPGAAAPLQALTAREREVLALVAAGRTNREIADALFISDKTASVHVTNIKEKLQVATRVEIAAFGIRLGLGEPPGHA